MDRHGSKEHSQKVKAYTTNRDAAPLWEACKLRTF